MVASDAGVFRGPRLATYAAMLLAAVIGVSGTAVAQEPARGETVRERLRPGYDGIGQRIGSFLVFPEVEVGLRYDNNLHREENDRTSASITSLRPRIRIGSQWSNHELSIDAGVEADVHSRHGREDTTDWFAHADGRVDLTRDANLSIRLGVEGSHEDRADPDSTALQDPLSRVRGSGSLRAFWRLNRLSLTGEASLAALSWDDVAATGSDSFRHDERDRNELDLTVRAGWEIVPEYEAFVRMKHNERRYRRSLAFGFDRDSRGWEVVAGTALDLGGVVFGEVFVGYVTQDYDAAALPSIDDSIFGGSLDWNVTPLTTISGSLEQTVEESTLSASGLVSTRSRLGVDHELRRNLILGAELAFTREDYEGVTRDDDREDELVEVGLGATWLLNPYVHLDFDLRLRTRDSSARGADFDNRVTTLTLRLQP